MEGGRYGSSPSGGKRSGAKEPGVEKHPNLGNHLKVVGHGHDLEVWTIVALR
jgi:hypothetical protein